MEVASGYYLNLFDNKCRSYDPARDVFILFNEPNSEPTGEELTKLAEIVEKELEINPSGETLRDAIEASGLECVQFGVQIRAEGLKSRTLDQQIQQAERNKKRPGPKPRALAEQER